MNQSKISQIFVTLTWICGGLAAWTFGIIAWMTIVAPRLPNIISFTIRTLNTISSPVIFVINTLPQAIFGFICGAVLSALTGHRKFFIFTAVAAPNLLSLLQLIDNYHYESLIYRGYIPNSIKSGMIERQLAVLLVFPTAIWAGAALANRFKRNSALRKNSS